MKPVIPSPSTLDAEQQRVLRPIKTILDDMTGVTDGELPQLPSTATLNDVIDRLNAITARMNRSGK